MHRRRRSKAHDQHIARPSFRVINLLKSDCQSLLQKNAFTGLQICRPFKVRQLDALQPKPITDQRKAVKLSVIPLPANQGSIVKSLLIARSKYATVMPFQCKPAYQPHWPVHHQGVNALLPQ